MASALQTHHSFLRRKYADRPDTVAEILTAADEFRHSHSSRLWWRIARNRSRSETTVWPTGHRSIRRAHPMAGPDDPASRTAELDLPQPCYPERFWYRASLVRTVLVSR